MHRVSILALLAACGSGAGDVDTPGPDPDPVAYTSCPEGRDPRFDALAEVIDAERQALGAPGLAVAVMLDGELAWCEGFGTRTPGEDDPMGPETLMRIGSVTKMLTAAAVMQEVDAGTLSVDATIPELLGADWQFAVQPGLANEMTVHHLLTHQGGIYDYLEIDAKGGAGALADWVDGWMLENLFLMAPPGSFWNYSNPNFTVAGRLVEVGSGENFVPRLEEGLFAPLGMERTVFRGADVLADGDYAVGLGGDWTGQSADLVSIEPDDYDNPWARPAGYAWSSVEDLGRFAAFLMHGDASVLSDASRQALVTPQVDALGIPGLDHYGYGIFAEQGVFLDDGFHALEYLTHNGAINGYAAEMHVVPDQGFALITLANTDGVYLRDAFAEALETFVDLPPVTEGPDLTPPDPADYAGMYEDPWNVGEWEFELVGEQFVMRMPLLDELGIPYEPEVTPLFGDAFLIEVQGIPMDVTFVHDGSEYRWARTRFFVAERAPEETKRRHAATADPERMLRQLAAPAPPRLPSYPR